MRACLLLLAACYTGAPASRDVGAAWRGHSRVEMTGRWGQPAQQGPAGENQVAVWGYQTTQVELPDFQAVAHPVAAVAHVDGPGVTGAASIQGTAVGIAWRPGEILRTRHEAAALVDPGGIVADVEGETLHWGPPNDANIRWGTLVGAHVGMGVANGAGSPLPSGDAYVGGMLTPTVALLGTYSFVAATEDGGSVIDQAAGVGVQYWPITRLALRAGPSLLLVSEPGVTNFALKPGVTTAASYAIVKVGTFALDLCFDVTLGPGTTFGSLGVGANLN